MNAHITVIPWDIFPLVKLPYAACREDLTEFTQLYMSKLLRIHSTVTPIKIYMTTQHI